MGQAVKNQAINNAALICFSTFCTALVALFVQEKANAFSDISQVSYAIVVLSSIANAIQVYLARKAPGMERPPAVGAKK